MRWALAIAYFWFGMLKYFPGMSPAEDLAGATIDQLTLGAFGRIGLILLATWECAVAFGLLVFKKQKWPIYLALVHMILTFTPLFLSADISFSHIPFGLSLVGQYIIKNLVFIVALLILLFEGQTKNGGNYYT
jgi:hypothetical protein